MRHLLVRNSWTRIRDVLGDKSNPYDTSNGLQQRDQETVYIPNPLIVETGELFYGQNIFVAESLEDIAQFTGAVEPRLLHHVRYCSRAALSLAIP